MKKNTVYSVAFLATFGFTNAVFAMPPQTNPMAGAKHHQNMNHHILTTSEKPAFPPFIDFPTPDELARMTPPEPVTEEKIKQRFAKHKAFIEKMANRDRKEAEKYAKDFARFQKHQADQLAKIMARAEKQREEMLNRISQREKMVLENFRQRNTVISNETK